MYPVRKYLRRPLILISLVILVFIVSGYFLTRGIILRKSLSSVGQRAERSGYHIDWNHASFRGLSSVFIRGIEVTSTEGNNYLRVDSIFIKLKVFPLLARNVRVSKVACRSVTSLLSEADSIRVPGIPSDSVDSFRGLVNQDLAATAYKYIRRFFNHIPSKVDFTRIEVNYHYAGDTSTVSARNLLLRKRKFQMQMDFGRRSHIMSVPVEGHIDRAKSQISFEIVKSDTGLLPIPVLKDKFGFSTGFDSLNFLIDLGHRNRHMVTMKGSAGISGLVINGQRLSTGNIIIQNFSSDYQIHIGPDYIEADSSSLLLLNDISFHPYLKLILQGKPVIDFKILPQQWGSNEFFNSLPPGMFTSITGTKGEGLLDFSMNFFIDLKQPDSLKFNIKLRGNDFKILSFGNDDYRMLNHSFTHRVYYKGNIVASFLVGPDNPDFAPFENISPFLRFSVMTSEDGSFFYHKGFNTDAFRESIVTNIHEGRFARGGSTISMQLVKNIFLTRNKTIARKIEEALIVWIIENERLVAKQRMYEVYLNIIEWGPGVYGITQASEYYFNKKPSELTLNESIFLASIVPRPKWFKYTFESNGRPRPFFASYFNRMKELMVRKEFISPADTLGVLPLVTLTGPASMALDTSEIRRVPDFIPLEPIRVREFKIN